MPEGFKLVRLLLILPPRLMTTDPNVNTALRRRLLSSVDDFIRSRENSTIASFGDHWSQLYEDLVSHHQDGTPGKDGTLDEDTSHLAYEAASYIEILCDHFKSLDLCKLAWSEQLIKQYPPTYSGSVPTESDETQISPAPYVKQAYEWLLQNLHNPYPSNAVRDEICAATGSQRKFIDCWFIEVRKRIGWNDLRKKEGWFRTRKEMVDAATRHFVKPDDKRPLLPQQELEFVMIEDRAARMYGEKMIPSQLATKLADSVKDMTPELKAQAMEMKRQERLKRRRVDYAGSEDDGSREGSETSDDEVHSPGQNLKRRTREESEDESSVEAPSKRSRVADDVPSPSPSPREASATLPSSSTTPTRKRRLSESEGSSNTKRPRHDLSSAGMRSVSDPTPVAPVILESFPDLDAWFSKVVAPGLATPLESVLGLQEGGGSLALNEGLWGSSAQSSAAVTDADCASASIVPSLSLNISEADFSLFSPESFNMPTPELSPSSSFDEDSDSLFGSEEGASAPVTPTSQPVSLATATDDAPSVSVASPVGAQPVSDTNVDDSFDFTSFDPSSFGLPSIDVPGLSGLEVLPDPFTTMLGNLTSADGVPPVGIVDSSVHTLDSYAGQAWQYPQQAQQDKVTPQSIMAGFYGHEESSFSTGGLFGGTMSSGGQQRPSQQSMVMGAMQWPATVVKHLPIVMPQLGMGQFVF